MKKRSGRLARMRVTADGEGVVSHAGTELLRELAGFTGLIDAWDKVLIGTYKAAPVHYPGSVLADLSVAIVDGRTRSATCGRCATSLRCSARWPPRRRPGGCSTG